MKLPQKIEVAATLFVMEAFPRDILPLFVRSPSIWGNLRCCSSWLRDSLVGLVEWKDMEMNVIRYMPLYCESMLVKCSGSVWRVKILDNHMFVVRDDNLVMTVDAHVRDCEYLLGDVPLVGQTDQFLSWMWELFGKRRTRIIDRLGGLFAVNMVERYGHDQHLDYIHSLPPFVKLTMSVKCGEFDYTCIVRCGSLELTVTRDGKEQMYGAAKQFIKSENKIFVAGAVMQCTGRDGIWVPLLGNFAAGFIKRVNFCPRRRCGWIKNVNNSIGGISSVTLWSH
jgi:hypothetical protein